MRTLEITKPLLWTSKLGMAAGAPIFLVSGVAVFQDHGVQVFNSDTVQWGPAPPVLPKGAEAAVLASDPGKPGPFTIRERHWHTHIANEAEACIEAPS
jgi:hypothetical protein